MMNIKLINELVAMARQLTRSEQGFTVDDFQTWTTDEAYKTGLSDGNIILARELLDYMNIKWEEE
jgi:hypothetical protein